MVFKVTSADKQAVFGDILFGVPNAENIETAVKTVSESCHKKAGELYGTKEAIFRLETELALMRKTDTAFHFLVLKEIADLSRSEGYPVMLAGNAGGSLIAFLLGITSYSPLGKGAYPIAVESVFGTFNNAKNPDFSFELASPIRHLIGTRLNTAFGYVHSDNTQYNKITWAESPRCAIVGEMADRVGTPTDSEVYQQEVYDQVLKDIGWKDKAKQEVNSCDFSTLVKIFGYLQGSFQGDRNIQKIYDPYFFTTRDDLFNALRSFGMSAEEALDTVKYGVWSSGEQRKEYLSLLEKYRVSARMKEYFEQVSNLWPAAACISSLQLSCISAWYQLHYPEEFEACTKKTL